MTYAHNLATTLLPSNNHSTWLSGGCHSQLQSQGMGKQGKPSVVTTLSHC